MQNYYTWTQIALIFILKLGVYEDIAGDAQKYLIHQIIIKMITDLYQLVKTNVIELMEGFI